jgi:8-oxo-dGTP pyrophosphatase MutT (NUDIX family)
MLLPSNMPEVECITLNGQIKMVQADLLIFRPAVYGIIQQDGKLLLVKMRATGKYHLPGGGIEVGERIEAALKREIREETGIEVEEVAFARFGEIFYYYEPSDRAYHGLHFFYHCRLKTTQLLIDGEVEDGSAESPCWVEICDLQPGDFQALGEVIIGLCILNLP